MARAALSYRRSPGATVAALLVVALVFPGSGSTAGEKEDCCNCQFSGTAALSGSEILPCAFDHPAGWKAVAGDDGAAVHVVVGAPPCGMQCTGSPGIAFSVGNKADSNAETMEEVWRQVMTVAGSSRCGGKAVTFFSTPGSDAAGLTGGLRFYVSHGGKKYGANATFTCSEPGGWLRLQEVFINTFRTNAGTTFAGR